MVNVEQHGMEAAAWLAAIETVVRDREREEIGMNDTAARIASQRFPKGNQPLLVPADHRLQSINHKQRAEAFVAQRRCRGVAKTKATNDDVDRVHLHFPKCKIGKRFLNDMKQARHQERLTEFYLENVGA